MGANKPHCCVDGCHVLNAGNAKHTCFCLALCIRALRTPHGQEAGQYPERRLQMTLRKETGINPWLTYLHSHSRMIPS